MTRCIHLKQGPRCLARKAEPSALPGACETCPHKAAVSLTRVTVQKAPPEPDPPQVTLLNALMWLKAEGSLLVQGPVEDDIAEIRAQSCLCCPKRRQRAASPDTIGWCGSCGCGGRDSARLSRKILMPAAKCPEHRWPT